MFDKGAVAIRKTAEKDTFHGDLCIENLCIAIVAQAAKDYRDAAVKYHEAVTDNEVRHAEGQLRAIERFFKSRWGNLLCGDNGEYILARLKRETGV